MTALVALPVDRVVDEVVEKLDEQGVVIVTAPPGSGKTTRVPPAVLRSVDGEMWLVQPRRVAAMLAARRIAQEWGEPPGETVGWSVRFDDRTGPRTRLVAMTEGMLLRRIQADPFLEDVAVVVLDEVHERSLDLDVALALLAELRRDARPDLKLVVMSATLDPAPLVRFFEGAAAVVHAEGRRFPVEVRYLPRPVQTTVPGAVAGAVRRMVDETAERGGHVLAFLPGVGEIGRARELLEDLSADGRGRRVEVLPLHGRLSLAEQARALATVDHRKVVLATNIAETSVTMVGVVAVVDSGRVRQVRFDPTTAMAYLETVDHSQASADQRAGRAGRTEAGVALRLWTPDQHRTRRPRDVPEVRRADLAPMLLRLLDLGMAPDELRWLEAPPSGALVRARAVLEGLGAVDGGGLTPRGRALAALPVHPRTGAVVLRGKALGGVHDAATAAALMSEGNPWRGAGGTDLAELVERVGGRASGGSRRLLRTVRQVRDQLVRVVRGGRRRLSDAELADCLLAGFPDRLARRRTAGGLRFKLASGRGAVLRRAEVLASGDLCVAVSVQGGSGGREDVIDLAAGVSEELAQSRATWKLRVRFDKDRVRVDEVAWVDQLELATRRPKGPVPDALVTAALVEAAGADPVKALGLSDDARAWLARVRFVAHHRPDLGLPAFGADDLLAVVAEMAPGCRSFGDLRARGALGYLKGRLSWELQQAVERLAPVSLGLPTGSRRRLTYRAPDEAPVLAVRIQQVFGWTDTPRVVGGRVPVLLHLLAPNQRPAQVTSDLASFWDTTWAEVRKDLRGRYPKHAWPEDPRTAKAEDRPRRKVR